MSLPVATICDMEFPKASPEEYELEQKRENLYHAEQELASFIAFADDFFASPTEKEETLERIRQNPEAILTPSEKPFMKKIAKAMMNIATLTKEVEDATEMVADQQLSPEVKAHIHKVCKEQQVFLEKKMEERLAAERVSMMAYFEQQMADMKAHFERQLVQQKTYFEGQLTLDRAKMDKALEAGMTRETKLRSLSEEVGGQRKTIKIMEDQLRSISKEVEVERTQQKAFQTKVKEFSEDIYMLIWVRTATPDTWNCPPPCAPQAQFMIWNAFHSLRKHVPKYTDVLNKKLGFGNYHELNPEKIGALIRKIDTKGVVELVDFE